MEVFAMIKVIKEEVVVEKIVMEMVYLDKITTEEVILKYSEEIEEANDLRDIMIDNLSPSIL